MKLHPIVEFLLSENGFNPERHNWQAIADSYKLKKSVAKGKWYNFLSTKAGKDFLSSRRTSAQKISDAEPPRPEPTPAELVERDREVRSLRASVKDWKSKYEHVLLEYEELDKRHNDFLLIEKNISPVPIKPRLSNAESEATAVTIWSDWHVDEVVRKEQVHEMNEYSPEIARKRVERLATNFIKLVEKERQSVSISNAIIHLGGDFIGGWIHDELQQTNSMSPVQATQFAAELVISAIDYVVKHGGFERIILLCTVGNHGRTTHRMQFANLTETSYETLIYDSVAKAFRNNEYIEINFPEGGVGYQKVYDYTMRFYHGHQVRYKDGVGGLTIPLNKKQAKWDMSRQADFNVMGHWHDFSVPNTRTVLNGSLKGWDAYAAENGFPYQPPIQAFFLVDKKRGRTITCPIFCD